MKDLITTIAAVTILMIFVAQFAGNQIMFSRITAADKTVENFQNILTKNGTDGVTKEELSFQVAECLGCDVSEVVVTDEEEQLKISAPLEKLIVCGEFLGISEEENKAVYRNNLWKCR